MRLLILVGLIGFLAYGPDLAPAAAVSPGPQVRADTVPPVIPSMVLLDRSDHGVQTSQMAGHPLLILNFLSPWCEPCLKEIPTLLRLASESDGRISVQGIVEGPVGKETLGRFSRRFKDRLPLVRDPSLEFSRALGVHGLPTSFLVDSGGHIVSRVTGAVDWTDPQVRRYLKGFTSTKAGF